MNYEQRIAELEDEVEGLRAGVAYLDARLEACTTLLELAVQRATLDGDAALELAKAIDLEVEKALMLRKKDDDQGIVWLRRVRDDLLSWHQMRPTVLKSIAEGKTRVLTTRERLQVVDGGAELPNDETPKSPPGDTSP